jgi:hypothetical protein
VSGSLRCEIVGNLDPFVVTIFLSEIDRQVRFGFVAAGDLAEAIHGPRPDEERFWYSVQGILIAAANVSKIFWPSDVRYASRGKALRELLGLTAESPLGPQGARKLRNHFEHFDDRIDKWAEGLARGESSVYVDSNVGSLEMISIPGLTSERVMRHFDPSDWSVSFRGIRYPLQPIQQALAELGARVKEARRLVISDL